MATIINPLGTIQTIYNKDGLTISELDIGIDNPQSVNLPVSSHSILLITCSDTNSNPKSVKLLNSINIGDVIEFKYVAGDGALSVLDANDNVIKSLNGPGISSSNRKMPDGSWFSW